MNIRGVLVFLTESQNVAQASLELTVLLPQPSKSFPKFNSYCTELKLKVRKTPTKGPLPSPVKLLTNHLKLYQVINYSRFRKILPRILLHVILAFCCHSRISKLTTLERKKLYFGTHSLGGFNPWSVDPTVLSLWRGSTSQWKCWTEQNHSGHGTILFRNAK